MWSTVSDADQQRLVAPKKVKVISEKLKGRTFCVVAKTEEWQVEVVRRQKQIWVRRLHHGTGLVRRSIYADYHRRTEVPSLPILALVF